MSRLTNIGIDVMSEEKSSSELIAGGIQALSVFPNFNLYVVGNQEIIETYLKRVSYPKSRLTIIPSTEIIGMKEDPTTAARKKTNASIVIGLDKLKEGVIDSFFSSGHTGAILSAALLKVGRIPGVKRPAIASPMPTSMNQKVSLFLDAGANVDCLPEYLKQFAIMGYVYTHHVLRIKNPKIGLLNLGEEEIKGNKLTKEAYTLIKNLPYPFVGNVEPHAFFKNDADVVICDGFVGNIFLKCAEALAEQISGIMKIQLTQNLITKLGALLLRKPFKRVSQEMTASKYGGAPLLGLRKPVFIGHGRSDARSVLNAIGIAIRDVEMQTHALIETEINNINAISTPSSKT
ncbi:phosphate acyltransferase [Spirochaetota bacterium]|nr:phosphate acyltransferase [Spirochaetota bacterium]